MFNMPMFNINILNNYYPGITRDNMLLSRDNIIQGIPRDNILYYYPGIPGNIQGIPRDNIILLLTRDIIYPGLPKDIIYPGTLLIKKIGSFTN